MMSCNHVLLIFKQSSVHSKKKKYIHSYPMSEYAFILIHNMYKDVYFIWRGQVNFATDFLFFAKTKSNKSMIIIQSMLGEKLKYQGIEIFK